MKHDHLINIVCIFGLLLMFSLRQNAQTDPPVVQFFRRTLGSRQPAKGLQLTPTDHPLIGFRAICFEQDAVMPLKEESNGSERIALNQYQSPPNH